ncbi:MAG: hypothetical protein J0M04_19590 [Verrucomicrobia bacterium]|nr:hypothetical protein [Verrucomicrobiota bacterium]
MRRVRAIPGTARGRAFHRGYALVVTLSLMILLALLAVGMLQLSAVALRAGQQERLLAEAKANAKVALMLALAQLQREMGPDQRISAPSGILDSKPETAAFDGVANPRLTGVWNASESPFARWTLDRPVYDKKATFRRWLVSGTPDLTNNPAMAKGEFGSGSAVLAPASADRVTKAPVRVPVLGGPRSGFAWWTADNGIRATVRGGDAKSPANAVEAISATRRMNGDGHSVLDRRLPSLSGGLDGRIVDLPTVDAATSGQNVAPEFLHDLTAISETLPVDVTTGGFRKCLNLYLDWLQGQSASARKAAGTVGRIRGSAAATDYRICSWDQLRNYESLARANGTLGFENGRPRVRAHAQSGNKSDPEWNPTIGDDRFRIQPVLLKLGYAVSYATERISSPADPAKPYALRLYLYPLAVLWNPYNVDLVVPEYCIHGFCPLLFRVDAGASGTVDVDLTRNQSATLFAFGPEMGGAGKLSNLVIPAGSTKALYPQPVRWQTHPDEHRHPRFRWHYYMWAQADHFTLGDADNFGGVLKNLRGNQSVANFASEPANEICGAAGDQVRVEVTPSASGPTYSFGMAGAHTDWWGNNGSGGDNAEVLQKFGVTTNAAFRVEADGSTPQISMIRKSEVPARTFGQLEGRPTPLLYFEFYRKAADENLFPAKMGSFSVAGNPIHAMTSKELGTNDAVTPWFESPYSFRFKAISSWFDVTKTFQLPPDRDDRVYFGGSYSPKGQLVVVDQEIPLSPPVSLGQLQHLPVFDYRPVYDPATATATTIWYGGDYGFHEGRVTQFAQNHAIGNSYASPGIPIDRLSQAGWRYSFNVEANHLRTDRSYIANAVLWDSWFCSTLAAQDGVLLGRSGRTAKQVAEDFFSGNATPPNDAWIARPLEPQETLVKSLFEGGRPAKDAYQRIAGHLRLAGGFNVNSVSEEAWAHFLGGLCSRPVAVLESKTGSEGMRMIDPGEDRFLITRTTLSNSPPAEQLDGKDRQDAYWSGAREVSGAQLRELAAAIVRQVKSRGPFLSTAEFVNRRLSKDAALATSGALQAALDDKTVSINAAFGGDTVPTGTSAGKPTYPFPDAATGPRLQGISGYVTQADLLATVGPAITPRSDTFTIRALGEARDADGVVKARAWCEAVVQRDARYLDPAETADTAPGSLKLSANTLFGRRFDIISFRWLAPVEVGTAAL